MSKNNRTVGFWSAYALIVGSMVGSGIFLLPASMAKFGTFGLWGWLIAGIAGIAMALVFVFLSKRANVTGGLSIYIYRIFGKFLGQQTSIMYWIYVWSGNLSIALAFSTYLAYFVPIGFYGINITTVILLWILTLINLGGLKLFSQVQIVFTILKLIPLVFIGIFGWFFIHPEYYSQFATPIADAGHHSTIGYLSSAALMAMWAFVGFETVSFLGANVKNAKRTVPLALITGMITVFVIYLANATVLMGMVSAPQLAQDSAPFATAAKIIVGPVGGWLVALGALISTFGALNGWIYTQGEALEATAANGILPKFLAHRSSKGVAKNALIITTIIETLFVIYEIFATPSHNTVDEFGTIIVYATIGALIVYFYIAIGEMTLIIQNSEKAFWKFIICIVGSLFAMFMIFSDMTSVFYGYIIITLTGFFFIYNAKDYPKITLKDDTEV